MLSTRCEKILQKQSYLEEENEHLKSRLDLAENESRLSNLVVHGLPEPESTTGSKHPVNQEASQSFISLCNSSLGLTISEADISVAYRIPAKGKDKHRPLIVKFTAQRTRNQVFSARTLLRKTSIYINEHLTVRNAQIYAKARALVKLGSASSTWTTGGWVFLRCSDAPGDKPTKITKLRDLEKLDSSAAAAPTTGH